MKTETLQYCAFHRRRETGLSCYKCGKFICAECARSRRDYIGYWCKACDAKLGPKPKPVLYAQPVQRTTWRFDFAGSLIGTVILTASVAAAGPIGFVIGIGLWWFIMSLRQ